MKQLSLVVAIALGAVACSESFGPAGLGAIGSSASVDPVYMTGNPTCEDLGYVSASDFSIKIDPPNSGTYPLYPGLDYEVTMTTDGYYVTWSSDLGVDAVIVKGGNNANVYYYDPESLGDTELSSPMNANDNGLPYGLSHVDFCLDWEVIASKTANTSYTRDFGWSIEKTADTTDLTMAAGQGEILVNYTVDVTRTGFVDSDFAVAGSVTVFNPAPIAAEIASIDDVMGSYTVTLDCGVAFPFTLDSLETLTCTYSTAVADATNLTNVATVNVVAGSLVGGDTAEALADFNAANVTSLDACVGVDDSLAGELGFTCASRTYNYTLAVGPYEVCGAYQVVNVASFLGTDGETGSDSWTVDVDVPCVAGCTLTQGYWKTHSLYGPARYDETWALIGENTIFFKSGKTYYQVLWTPPAGNAYYILAHQYIAAQLNGLNGADTTAASAAFATATTLLNTYSPAQVKGSVKTQFVNAATVLDNYNNGLIGPGHCDE